MESWNDPWFCTVAPLISKPLFSKCILREENVVLRQLLGYGRPTEASLRLGVPEFGAELPGSSLKDVLFVGLDIDTFQGYEVLIPDQQLHIGVSILDTRHLVKLLALEHEGRLSCAISSYRFTLGDSKYCQRARNKFLFEKSKSAESIPELKLELEQLVEDRDAVLVCHSTNCELKMLRNLDIDLRPLYVIDTNKVAQYVLQLHSRYDLGKLLGVLGIPYALLHAAGNDARFCLQALLMLAVKDAEMGPPDSADKALLRMPEGISHTPRPRTRGEIDAALPSGRQARKEAKAARKIEKRAARVAAKIKQLRLEREREDTQAAGLNSEETGSITGELPQDT